MLVRFNNEMTCHVQQHNKDISTHQGRYLDLKLYPELASGLPEAREWPALGEFVGAINKCEAFCTCGCTASGITPGGHEAPFVDIAFADKRLRTSPGANEKLSSKLLELDGATIADDFIVELCNCSATFCQYPFGAGHRPSDDRDRDILEGQDLFALGHALGLPGPGFEC
jgi:hypothetical protein